MKLQATTISEQGKPVSKTANESIEVELTVNRQVIGSIYLDYKDDIKDGCEEDEWIISWHYKLKGELDPEIICQGHSRPEIKRRTQGRSS